MDKKWMCGCAVGSKTVCLVNKRNRLRYLQGIEADRVEQCVRLTKLDREDARGSLVGVVSRGHEELRPEGLLSIGTTEA